MVNKNSKEEKSKLLQHELGVTEIEFKELKKKFKSLEDRDDRAVQTMLRTTSRNHYTLNEMVDRKARIMITINSLILSLIIGKVIGKMANIHYLPILILGITCGISIIFSILAIRPDKKHGNFSPMDLINKEGNPLFFGNFLEIPREDYEKVILDLATDKDQIYTAMVRDIYYLGQVLDIKRKHLRISLITFMVGIILALLLSFYVTIVSI